MDVNMANAIVRSAKNLKAYVVAAGLIAAFLISLCGCSSLPYSHTGEASIDPGDASDVQGARVSEELPFNNTIINKASADEGNLVITLLEYSVDSSLPSGAVPLWVSGRADESAGGHWEINEDGVVSDGWAFVNARFRVTNNEDVVRTFNVGPIQLMSFNEAGERTPILYGSDPIWFELGEPNTKSYYNATVQPYESVEFGMSFICRKDLFDNANVYLTVGEDIIGLETTNIKGYLLEPAVGQQ